MASNTKMVPTCSVVVMRDGERVTPTIGEAFSFTADEVKQINEVQEGALRKPTNEDKEAAETPATPSAEGSQARARGGKKQATAGRSDQEQEESKDDLDPPAGEGGGPGAGTVDPTADDDL